MEAFSVIGKSMPNIDGVEKATGVGVYTSDIKLPRMLYGKFLRSPYPHAKVKGFDTGKAEKLPGVKAVLSFKDVPRVCHKGMTLPVDEFLIAEQYIFDERVSFIGEGVAAVAAETEEIAEKDLSLI
jgi:xanthine dehydrogenase molybdenum-binding subunit